MQKNMEAQHIVILYALPGRLRVLLENAAEGVWNLALPIGCICEQEWNPRLKTLLLRYDASAYTQEQILLRVVAAYARSCKASLIHIRHCEEENAPLAPSAVLALGGIGLDAVATLAGSTLMPYTRCISLGTTLAAVFEHGYHELKTRGSFDPEVMSIVYLFNTISKATSAQSALVAWLVTFGRHLIPRAPREQAYLARENGNEMMMTAVRCTDKRGILGTVLDGSVRALTQKERRIMGL